MSNIYSVPIKGRYCYSTKDLKDNLADSNDSNLVIVEVGGVRIPLQHTFIVTKEMVVDGAYPAEAIGSLVIDLDA